MHKTLPFDQWPIDPFQRGYEVENALGKALIHNLKGQMQFVKKKCAAIAPALTDDELEAVTKEAAFGGIYALLMVLDGVAATGIDEEHGIQWSLQAQIQHYGGQTNSVEVPLERGGSVTLSSFRPAGTKQAETVEVLPKGMASATLFTNGRKVMSITVDFGPEKEALVWEKAARFGQKADERIYDLVSEWLEEPEPEAEPQEALAQTLAEALTGHIGTQRSGRGDLSQNTGKAFARLMVEKRKAGKL